MSAWLDTMNKTKKWTIACNSCDRVNVYNILGDLTNWL